VCSRDDILVANDISLAFPVLGLLKSVIDITNGIRQPVREADHPPPSSAGFKEWVELYLHSPNTPAWRGA